MPSRDRVPYPKEGAASVGINVQRLEGRGLACFVGCTAEHKRRAKDGVRVQESGGGMPKVASGGVQKVITAFRVAARRLKAQFPCCTFIGSSVCQTKLTRINPHVAEVNLALRATCADCGWLFLSNDYIMQGDLVDDVHLSVWGNLKLHRRLRVFLASALGLRLGPNVSGLE